MSKKQRMTPLMEIIHKGERTVLMGILNVTPDSFSDGGQYETMEAALHHAEEMARDGADIIDVGGESTRPGSEPVAASEEMKRVLPVIHAIRDNLPVAISIDTMKASVARSALDAGADMVNDVSGLTADPEMAAVVASAEAPICLMHLPSPPRVMQHNPVYRDVVAEVKAFLLRQAEAARTTGISVERLILDPGFGFGKTAGHNLELLHRLRELVDMGYPIMIGTSRKSTIGRVLGELPIQDRLEGTAATVALAIAAGAAIIRVHDVREMARVARMTDAVVRDSARARWLHNE